MGKPVLYTKHEAVATLKLKRAPGNLVNQDMMASLREGIDKATTDDNVRVVVVTGGEDVFSEGIDMDEFNSLSTGARRDFVKMGQKVLLSLEQLPKPTIAATAGKVLGAGLEIALACDMRVASENAQFGHPEVSMGLVPMFGNLYRLERLLGRSRSRSLVFFGEPIPAWEAVEIGLVGKVSPREALMEEARISAARIAAQPAEAIRAAKISMVTWEKEGLEAMLEEIAESIGQHSKSRMKSKRARLSPNRE